MITEKEIESVNLSPTKKDFYQIWNELLDTAGKISERWDPSSTNESDPGVVLLKVLTALGDKLNYNIDKNILEAFMPSATQQESMRKLCDMMGYSMKYYRSATTTATIQYTGSSWPTKTDSSGNTVDVEYATIPQFSILSDEDDEIHYITLEEIKIYNKDRVNTVDCIEGQICTCENDANTNNLITLTQLDDNNRYYLPESMIAENGIFIKTATINTSDATISYDELWSKVDNLNVQALNSIVYKIGYDSSMGVPYIQFPSDIANLIGDGLQIKYVRTNGVNGNISARTLKSLNKPDGWDDTFSADDFTAVNTSAATNGANAETINDAYINYKKTIGTFDTLVTCRDYMNKIYQLTESTIDTTPLVSNIIVSDIRDDINNAFTLCEFDDYGIKYVDKVINTNDTITNFDIILYPFTAVTTSSTKKAYENSFRYSAANSIKIEEDIENYKTISHTIRYPKNTDIVCIKNYLKLNANITTINKVNSTEESSILANIYSNIYNTFYSRKLDFGETIPFDDIQACIEKADTRIKNVSLDEPILYTAFMTADNNEYGISSSTSIEDIRQAKIIYNKLALRNILAGKVALFNYYEDFKPEYTEQKYPEYKEGEETKSYEPIYPTGTNHIVELDTNFKIGYGESPTIITNEITLADNEVVQFRAPSFKTTTTYPAYVNYYISLKEATGVDAIPAKFITLGEFMLKKLADTGEDDHWSDFLSKKGTDILSNGKTYSSDDAFKSDLGKYGALWKRTGTKKPYEYTRAYTWESSAITYCCIEINEANFIALYSYITILDMGHGLGNYSGLYKSLGWSSERVPGYLVDSSLIKYHICNTYSVQTTPLTYYFIQVPNSKTESGVTTWYNGLGKDAVLGGVPKNCEYKLKDGESLLINYTESSDSDSTESGAVINKTYSEGTIIKPNFLLKDSNKNNQTGKVSFTKTSGYDFAELDGSAGKNGMYSLGSDETIEIREPSELVLGRTDTSKTSTPAYVYNSMNIYWTLQNEELHTSGNVVTFPFDNNGKYTLKENEYFYFTDINKLDMSWYSTGTEIINTGNININKPNAEEEEELSADEILSLGMNAIPWIKITPTESANLTFKEYQYINLVSGDKLIDLASSKTGTGIMPIGSTKWENCKFAQYKYADAESTETLPEIDVDSATWQAITILQLNVGPSTVQTIRKTSDVEDSITIKFKETSTTVTLTPQIDATATGSSWVPLSIKSNYACQSASATTDVRVLEESTESGETVEINDFKLKVIKHSDLVLSDKTTSISVDNFGDCWTKLKMSDFTSEAEDKTLAININLPSTTNYYGLVMMYLIAEDSETPGETGKPTLPYLTCSTELKIFNYNSSSTEATTEEWWKDYKTDNKYYLKCGINVIKVEASGIITVHPDSKHTATIILGDLDIVAIKSHGGSTSTDLDKGLNLDVLKYYYTSYTSSDPETTEKAAKELLKNINIYDTDHEFYYNCVLENSEILNINTKLDNAGSPIETLATPTIWYDYNNVNNKFVISEIDATYMKKYGINIAKSSKRNY